MDLPKRRPTRLKDYDYSSPGAYFVTICTKDKKELLSKITVGEGLCALPKSENTAIGDVVEKAILFINNNRGVLVDKYVIMPNHIHLIIILDDSGGGGTPPLQNIIGKFKSYTTNQFGGILWQRSFHDHIIRGEQDYKKIWEYIDTNTAKWKQDCFYNPEK